MSCLNPKVTWKHPESWLEKCIVSEDDSWTSIKGGGQTGRVTCENQVGRMVSHKIFEWSISQEQCHVKLQKHVVLRFGTSTSWSGTKLSLSRGFMHMISWPNHRPEVCSWQYAFTEGSWTPKKWPLGFLEKIASLSLGSVKYTIPESNIASWNAGVGSDEFFFSGRCELLVSGRVPESNISPIKAHLKISSPVPPQKFHNSPLKMDGLEVGRRSPFHFGSW